MYGWIEKVAPVLTSFARSFLLGALTLIVAQKWGMFAALDQWKAIADAGFMAMALTVYLYFDKGFTAYGVGSK